MNRRTFLRASATAAAVGAGIWRMPAQAARMERVALGTLTFRGSFRSTADPNQPATGQLQLTDVPGYFADRFGVHTVEFWSMHFDSTEPAYLADLRKSLEAARSALINVQVDADYRLAAEEEAVRQEGLATARKWLDAAAAVGAQSARLNTGDGSVDQCVRSFKEMSQYAKEKGLVLLVENHGGLSSDPDVLVRLCTEVGGRDLQTVPDFGNFGEIDPLEGLSELVPYAHHLVSAKTAGFNEQGEHTAFDFAACVRLCEELGFTGVYSGEYFGPTPFDAERIAEWMVQALRANVRSE